MKWRYLLRPPPHYLLNLYDLSKAGEAQWGMRAAGQHSPRVLKGLCWGTKEKKPGFKAFVMMTSNSSSKSFLREPKKQQQQPPTSGQGSKHTWATQAQIAPVKLNILPRWWETWSDKQQIHSQWWWGVGGMLTDVNTQSWSDSVHVGSRMVSPRTYSTVCICAVHRIHVHVWEANRKYLRTCEPSVWCVSVRPVWEHGLPLLLRTASRN